MFGLRNFAQYMTLAALGAATFAQTGANFLYWGGFVHGGDPAGRLVMLMGGSLAVIEVFQLALIAQLLRNGARKPGWVWLAVFFIIFAANFTADFSVVSNVFSADQGQIELAGAGYQAHAQRKGEADATIARLHAELARAGLDRPSAAIAAELSARQEIAHRYEANGAEIPASHVRVIARLQSAEITARQLEGATTARDAEVQWLSAHERPPEARANFEALSGLANAGGVHATPALMRVLLAALVVLVVKIVVNLGWWVALPHDRAPQSQVQTPKARRRQGLGSADFLSDIYDRLDRRTP